MALHRFAAVVCAGLLASFALVGARQAAAGDPPRPDARAAAVAAALETANLRAQVKLELARLLDREGRTEEALAALLEADRLLADAARLAADLAAPPPRGAPAAPSRPPAPRAPVLLGPVVPGPESRPPPARRMPRRDPVAPAVRWLLGRQDVGGSFDVLDGANVNVDVGRPTGRTVAVTAWTLLALAEVAPGDGPGAVERGLAEQAAEASARAAGFLLAGAREDGTLAASTEDHCLAGWALASALSRLGPRIVSAMPKSHELTAEAVERTLLAALRRALSMQDAVTGRLVGGGAADERLRAAAAFVGFLHEIEPLPMARSFGASLEEARKRLSASFDPSPADEAKTPAGREILALLRRDRTGLATAADAQAPFDPLHLLYGTVAVSALGTDADGEAWWHDVLVPAMNRQAIDGVWAGSFPSGPERLGRTHATALALLAWLYPEMEWRAPATGN